MRLTIKSLAIFALITTFANAAGFDTTHQGKNARGLAHHRRHHHHHHQAERAPVPAALAFPEVVKRAGAAYNETDHDPTASIEIGGAQTTATTAAAATSASVGTTAAVSSSAVPATTSSAAAVSSSGVSSAGVSSSSAVVSSTSASSSSTAQAISASSPSVVSSTIVSSSSAPSSASSSTDSSSSIASSSAIPTDPTSAASQIISTVQQTVTDSSTDPINIPSGTSRNPKTGSVAIKTASVSSTASAAAAGAGGETKGMSAGTRTAIIVVCVVGGIALGAFALWTIIRRWKLRPSQRFDGRMKPLNFSPTSPDAFYEKTLNRHNSSSSADRQRRQFVDELDEEVYDHHVHAQQYDMTGMEGGAALAGVASSYPHQESYEGDEGYVDLRRGPSLTHAPTQTFAGIGAGGASFPAAYPHHQQPDMYHDDAGSEGYHGGAQPLAREPSLGRPTRGEGPYAAAQFAGAGPRY